MYPKPNKTEISAVPYPQYHPTFFKGVQRGKSPKMTPRIYRFIPLSRNTEPKPRKEYFMPRMSKKRKTEWAFFLNHRNRITHNTLCRGCTHDCKQSFRAIVIFCPRYYSKRRKKEDNADGR